jgi:hypothetical protein
MFQDFILSAVYEAIGEVVAHVLSKIIGTALDIKPKTARRIGEMIVLGLIVVAVMIIVLKYS